MTSILFFAQGIPKGQPRPRAFAFNGKARVFDPGTAEGWKSQVAIAAEKVKPSQPLVGPLAVRLDFYFPRPKKHFKKGVLRVDAPVWHVSKPDADNLAKAVLDALTSIGFWNDDDQVSKLSVRKLYSRQNGYTGCAVAINEITSDDQVHFRD